MKNQLNMILSSPKLWSEFFLSLHEGNYNEVYNWINLVMRWKDAGCDKINKCRNATKKTLQRSMRSLEQEQIKEHKTAIKNVELKQKILSCLILSIKGNI